MKAKYNIAFISSDKLENVIGIHKKLMATRTYCAERNVEPVANIAVSKTYDTLYELLKTLGYTINLYATYNPANTVIKSKGNYAINVVEDAEQEVINRSECVVIVGDNESVYDKISSDLLVFTYESMKKEDRENVVINPLDVINKEKNKTSINKDPYKDFEYVNDYGKPQLKEEPSFYDHIPPEIRDLIPPKNNGPFANN